jgi:hypothetical protein
MDPPVCGVEMDSFQAEKKERRRKNIVVERVRRWEEICVDSREKVVKFSPPPPYWFLEGRILGVSFEGGRRRGGREEPHICCISCSEGVYINTMSDPLVQFVLGDPKHIHFVFGKEREGMACRGADVRSISSLPSEQKKSLPSLFQKESGLNGVRYCLMLGEEERHLLSRREWISCAERRLLSSFQVNLLASNSIAIRFLAYTLLEKNGDLSSVLSSLKQERNILFPLL